MRQREEEGDGKDESRVGLRGFVALNEIGLFFPAHADINSLAGQMGKVPKRDQEVAACSQPKEHPRMLSPV